MLGWTRHGFCPWRLFDIAGTNVADARGYEGTRFRLATGTT